MSIQTPADVDPRLVAITARRAEILRELAEADTEREIAARLGLSLATVRSHAEQLKTITGLSTTREMGRWWQSSRHAWIACLSRIAGCPGPAVDPATTPPEEQAFEISAAEAPEPVAPNPRRAGTPGRRRLA